MFHGMYRCGLRPGRIVCRMRFCGPAKNARRANGVNSCGSPRVSEGSSCKLKGSFVGAARVFCGCFSRSSPHLSATVTAFGVSGGSGMVTIPLGRDCG